MSDSLQGRCLEQLERDPDRRAVAFYRGPGEVDWLSRRRLFERAAWVAAGLADQGLGADDVCLLMLPSGEEVPVLLLGALLLGSVPLLTAPPVFWDESGERDRFVKGVVARSGASLVVGPPPAAGGGVLDGVGARCVASAELTGVDRGRPLASLGRNPGEVATMQMTSGTTGVPRICVWRQAQVLAALDGMAAALGSGEDEACFNWTPLYHDLGLVNCFLYCLTRGIPVTMMSPAAFVREPALWLRGMSETRSTTTWSPNFGYSLAARRADEKDLEGVSLRHVTGFWNAAERVHLSTMEAFSQRFAPLGVSPGALRTSYGCAENVGGATFSRQRDRPLVELVDRRRLWQERRACRVEGPAAGSSPKTETETEPVMAVGSAHPGVEIEIVGNEGNRLAEGEVGEIHLRTASMMQEYLGEPRASAAATDGGVLHTGDLG